MGLRNHADARRLVYAYTNPYTDLMTVSPPKCRTCGKIEWRHVCGGSLLDAIAEVVTIEPPAVPKTDRKEYLKLKARSRRLRQSEARKQTQKEPK